MISSPSLERDRLQKLDNEHGVDEAIVPKKKEYKLNTLKNLELKNIFFLTLGRSPAWPSP